MASDLETTEVRAEDVGPVAFTREWFKACIEDEGNVSLEQLVEIERMLEAEVLPALRVLIDEG